MLFHETDVPPQTWCLGRVTETTAGSDGYVRVDRVHLKTAAVRFTRPVVKISTLPQCDQ